MKKLFIASIWIILLSFAAHSRTIRVPTQYPAIQAGIRAAVNGDTVMVADGIYRGVGNKNLDFLGKGIVVMSENGPENCIIDCDGSGRGFRFHSGEDSNSVVQGFSIINGHIFYNGGGIYCNTASPTIEYCIIRNNYARNGYGGGIYVNNCSPTIIGCTIYGNITYYPTGYGGLGGGIYAANSDMTVNSCIIAYNGATGA